MNTDSYWLATANLPRFPALNSEKQVDVVVIGAGITGITAAYLLKKAGKTVALVERDRCVSVDTAATTAHLTCVLDKRLTDLVSTFGQDHARAAWDAGLAAIDQIERIVEETASACEFRRVPGYLHASLINQKDEREDLRREADLATDLGFVADFLPSAPLVHRPAMRIANQAKFHPALYLRSLLETIDGRGSFVHEHSEVTEFSEHPLGVKANGHLVKCKHIVIATHVPLMGNNGMVSAIAFQSKLASYSSYAIAARLEKNSLPEASFWDTSDPYYYLRIDKHRGFDTLIFGGEDHKTGQVVDTRERFDHLESLLKKLVPAAKVEHRWSGQVVETSDGLPFIGELGPHQFVATGYAGNGMTFGTLAAMMATDWVQNKKNPWASLFDVHRKKVRVAWDYLTENLDYPYYLVKDRLLRTQGSDPETLRPGEGKILRIDGQRVAAARDQNGNLSVVSATCTHLGCVVHWNDAEHTWDCPCHGSRFKPNGDVLAGPAEEPLPEIHEESEK